MVDKTEAQEDCGDSIVFVYIQQQWTISASSASVTTPRLLSVSVLDLLIGGGGHESVMTGSVSSGLLLMRCESSPQLSEPQPWRRIRLTPECADSNPKRSTINPQQDSLQELIYCVVTPQSSSVFSHICLLLTAFYET